MRLTADTDGRAFHIPEKSKEGRIVIRRRTTFRVAAAAATLLAAGALAACSSGGGGSNASSNSKIVACGDLALAGPYAQIGETDNWGAEAYFKHVDATGGILGHQVTYITLNNQSSAAQSELDARKCIDTYHAQFIIGPESGADTESALPLAIANKTILISLSSGWQSNGYPASELNSWGFPGFYDVFYEDQLASVQNLIVPRHYTRVALIEDNCGPVCLANQGSVKTLAQQYGFSLVSTQIDQVGQTDVTPEVLAMLAAKPQIILFGLVPGTDSITAIRAIRAQDPTIPISECSACELPSFISAAGGPSAMQNIYVLGSMQDWLTQAKQGTSAQEKATATGLEGYIAGMQAAGLGNANAIDNSQEGWDAGLEISWAIQQAGNLDETTVMQKLQHLNINTLGIIWNRNPSNYENITQVLAAMEIINPDGSAALYK
jgi:ABC-type branched-subunit amino acid transport system substrate-binding protein